MEKIENEFWCDSRPYYILYEDKMFLKNMYAQLFNEFPDIGQIAYIGASTRRISKDYFLDGEQTNSMDKRKSYEKQKIDRNNKQDNRKKAGITFRDNNEESQIREYANIQEIKEMNNMLFYKDILRKIVNAYAKGKCNNLCFVKDKVCMYDSYKDEPDVFVKMGECCVWLKKEYMDTTALNIANVMGTVNMIGYILEEKSEMSPRVVKALAIYT